VLAQRVLEAIFGEDAVRRLAKQAKRDLDARVEALMAAELARYTATLDAVDVRPEQAGEILAAVEDLDDVRSSDGRLQLSSQAQPAAGQLELGASAPAALEAAVEPPLEGEIIESRQDQQ
jgi:hypothetical protein